MEAAIKVLEAKITSLNAEITERTSSRGAAEKLVKMHKAAIHTMEQERAQVQHALNKLRRAR